MDSVDRKYDETHTSLTDKDCQQFNKVYRLICELYYESRQSKANVEDLINLTEIIPQIIENKTQSNAILIFSQMEILKAKAKNEEVLRQKIDKAIEHLRRPVKEKLNAKLVTQLLKKSELFTIGCIISIRLFQDLIQSSEMDPKHIFQCLGNNLFVNPNLAVELLQLFCSSNEANSHLCVREGIVKSLFLNYIPQVMKQKLPLYKCIKLLKVIGKAEPSILKEREKILSTVICTYDEYIPIVSDICMNCYDVQYCTQIDKKLVFQNIDQLYLWSYAQSFCQQMLSKQFVDSLLETLSNKGGLSADVQSKLYAIVGNYCKFCEYPKKQFLKILPKHQESLLNFLKMCISLVRLDSNIIQLINWPSLDSMVAANTNAKVSQLHKMLKEMIGRAVQVGTLNNSLKSIFSWEKHADLLSERISRIPKNNSQLQEMRQILNQTSKSGASQFDRDTLQMMKEKAVSSIHTAISKQYKLNLNPLINEWELNSVELLSKFLQVVELNLLMNENAVTGVNIDKILEMIRWLQENYNGQIVDWGGIIQILAILFEEEQWVKHLSTLPKDCFWLLQVEELKAKSQKQLFFAIDEAVRSQNVKKLSIIVGFLGKTLQNEHKIKLLKAHQQVFKQIKQELSLNTNYKLHLMMFSYFLKGWHLDQSEANYEANNKAFQSLIGPLVDIVITNYRALPQEHYLLQSCLPFKIQTHSLTKNTNQLVNSHGKLAAYLCEKQPKTKANITSDRFNSISSLSSSNLLENLKFLVENPQLINASELQRVIDRITQNKDSFWDLYPHYVNILSLLIELMDADNSDIKHHISENIIKLITEVEANEDIQKDEKEDLLYDMCDTLENLQKKGSYIEIERVRTIVTKITEEEVREEIIYILNNYKIKQEPPKKPQPIKKEPVNIPIIPSKSNQPTIQKQENKKIEQQQKVIEHELIMQANLQNFVNNSMMSKQVEIPKPIVVESLQEQFQSVKYQPVKTTLFDALQILKRIVEKKEPTSRFNDIYPILVKSTPTDLEKELMGSLLAKFYPMEFEERALTLLLDKQRTTLAKELFEELVRKYIHAFKLVRRWKFESREALDIAMCRIKQGYLDDACVVATYNLKKSSEIQYFYSSKYQIILIEVLCKVVGEDEVTHFLTLIGTVAKLPQIKQQFIAHKIHTKVMPLNTMFPLSVRVNSSLCYALSTLSFQQTNACTEIVSQKEPLAIIYECLKAQSTNKIIVEPGVCLIANLSYPNSQIKETLRQRKTISLLLRIFEDNLERSESSIYKQLLRSMGNLSMNKVCTQELIEGHFCDKAILMAEILDFFVYYDEKKARLMKLLINLTSNLANHKTKLDIMHKEKITLLIVTMLQTTEKNSQLLAGCIDTLDALCQSPEIELYMIEEKRLLYILMDVLKLQEEVLIILKAGRLVSNLSIHNQCIPFILKTSILSVIGNVVVPNLYIGLMEEQQSKRMEGYILKILTRVYQCKPELQLVLKSGYLDCLVRTIEMIEVEDSHLEILFFYSSHLPNFLNKRAFSCLINILMKKVDSQVMIGKCIVSFKNLLTFSYNRDDEDEVIETVPHMYEKILRSQFLVDGLFLLVYHLLRSHKLRKILQKRSDKVIQMMQKLGEQEIYVDIARCILFLIHNPTTPLWFPALCEHQQEEEEFYKLLKNGFKCRLYRADGSHKQAKLDIDEQYNIRLYKYPDGEIKSKYVLNINHIRDLQIDFREKDELWSHTVFAIQKSFLQSHVPNKKLCVTIIGSSRWGEVKLLNFQFSSEQEKLSFYQCMSHLIYLFKI